MDHREVEIRANRVEPRDARVGSNHFRSDTLVPKSALYWLSADYLSLSKHVIFLGHVHCAKPKADKARLSLRTSDITDFGDIAAFGGPSDDLDQ